MRTLCELVRREVEQRWLYLGGGLLLGLLALAAPVLPVVGDQPAQDVREAAAVMLFWLASLSFSLLLGATVFGGDLAERRMGFDFSRPLGGWTILFGRLGGTLLVALGSTALVVLPTLAVGRRVPALSLWPSSEPGTSPGEAVLTWLVAVTLLVLLAHYLRTFALASSAWRLLDLAALVLAFVALRWIAGGLLAGLAWRALLRALEITGIGLLVGLLAAVAAQVVAGRTAVRLGHRLLSLVFWLILGVALAAAAAFASWVLAAGPGDLERPAAVDLPPAGDWILLSGTARGRAGYEPNFLYRVTDGTHFRLPAGNPQIREMLGHPWPLASANGSRACWLDATRSRSWRVHVGEWRPFALPSELWCADLGEEEPAPRPASVELPRTTGRRLLALSPDGRSFARLDGSWLTVEEVDRPVMLAREVITEVSDGELLFDRAGRRLFIVSRRCGGGCRLQVFRYDIASRGFERLIDLPDGAQWLVDPAGDRLLLVEEMRGGPARSWLADLDSGELRPVRPGGDEGAWVGQFLADGRLLVQSGTLGVAIEAGGGKRIIDLPLGGGELWLLDREGKALRQLPRGAERLQLGGQAAPDQLLVGRWNDWPKAFLRGAATTYLVDLRSGEERLVGEGVVPVARPQAAVGSVSSRLLTNAAGDLLLLDPETLELRVVLAAG